ncbi:hypothetical protein AB1L05_22905 [Cytobacillus horneckiae]|uniref:hypothetical protein n=1 Tax=Cytobacillus horneckiae TaxID=549687 RepID=UPI0039A166C8
MNPSFNQKHYFTPENNQLLQILFSHAGMQVSIEPYNSFKRINLTTENFGASITLKFNLQIHQGQKSYINIQDSIIGVNTYYYEHEKIIELCIDVIENFANQIGVNSLRFISYLEDNVKSVIELQETEILEIYLKIIVNSKEFLLCLPTYWKAKDFNFLTLS